MGRCSLAIDDPNNLSQIWVATDTEIGIYDTSGTYTTVMAGSFRHFTNAMSVSPNGLEIAAARRNNDSVFIFDMLTESAIETLRIPSGENATGVVWNPNNADELIIFSDNHIYSYIRSEGAFYILLEYIGGASLSPKMSQDSIGNTAIYGGIESNNQPLIFRVNL